MRRGVTGTCRPPEREPASDGVVLRSPGVGQPEPRSVKQHRRGSLTYLDAVPSAVTHAWNIPMKNVNGFSLTITKYMSGRKIPPWMMRPTITVIMYMPSCLATTSRSAMEMIFPQMRQAIPRGEYLRADKYTSTVEVLQEEGKANPASREPLLGRHLPHDRTNQLHDDLIQHIEKLQHQFGPLSHFAHDDSESHKESNQAWNTEFSRS